MRKSSIINEYRASELSVVVVVKTLDDKILLLKRSETAEYMPNMWSLPGGIVENESIYDGALREVEEETGLELDKLEQKQLAKYDGSEILFFTSTVDHIKPVKIDYENSDSAWFTLAEIKELDENKEIIPHLFRDIKKTLFNPSSEGVLKFKEYLAINEKFKDNYSPEWIEEYPILKEFKLETYQKGGVSVWFFSLTEDNKESFIEIKKGSNWSIECEYNVSNESSSIEKHSKKVGLDFVNFKQQLHHIVDKITTDFIK